MGAHLRTSEVIKAVREAIIEHASNAQEIFQKAMDFLTGEITCEGIFGADVCSKLQKAAQMLGEKTSDINDAIRAAVKKHVTKVSDVLKFVQEYLVDKAKNFKCENVLNADLCAKIMKIGGHFKDGIDTINKGIKEAIVHGATGVQEIYNVAVAWLRDHVKASKCEDLISADVCQKIRDFANKVHVSAKDVLQAVKEAIAEGAWDPVDLYKKAIEYIKSKISCEAVMGKATCDKIRALADKFSVSLAKVDEVLREAIASGVTKVTELYKVVVKYIMDRWTDLIGDEEMLALSESSDELILPGLREALEKVVDKVLNDLKVKSDDIRAMIKKVIMEGKIRIREIKQKIKDLLAEIGSQDDQMFQMNKQELIEKLKEALKKAKGMSKILIEKLMKMSKEQLAKAKALIEMILDKYGMQQDSFIDVLLDSTHEQILKDMEAETTAFSDMIVEDMINEANLL